MMGGFPLAIMDLSKVENASHEELLSIAKQHNIEINNKVYDKDFEEQNVKSQNNKNSKIFIHCIENK